MEELTEDQLHAYNEMVAFATQFAALIEEKCPDGLDRAEAIRYLEKSLASVRSAILHTPIILKNSLEQL